MTSPPQRKRRLGEILMDAGVVTDAQLNQALSEQRKWGGKLGRTLVDMGVLDEGTMTAALSRQLQIPSVDPDTLKLAPDVLEFLRVDIAERYGVFPVAGDRKNKTVTLATSDPTNGEQLQELSFFTGMKIQMVVATASSIDRAIRRHYYGESTVASDVTTPRKLGLNEAEYGEDELSHPGVSNPGAQARRPAGVPADFAAQQAKLNERVTELERLLAAQARALRGMLELLLEKGVVDRDQYLGRVRGKEE